jgi:hypothetical protein
MNVSSARFRNAAAGILLAAAFCCAPPAFARATPEALPDIAVADLPKEGREVLHQIRNGGPFRYDRDGVVFRNREGLLPAGTKAIITSTRCIRPAPKTVARAVLSAVVRPSRPKCVSIPVTTINRSRGSANEGA